MELVGKVRLPKIRTAMQMSRISEKVAKQSSQHPQSQPEIIYEAPSHNHSSAAGSPLLQSEEHSPDCEKQYGYISFPQQNAIAVLYPGWETDQCRLADSGKPSARKNTIKARKSAGTSPFVPAWTKKRVILFKPKQHRFSKSVSMSSTKPIANRVVRPPARPVQKPDKAVETEKQPASGTRLITPVVRLERVDSEELAEDSTDVLTFLRLCRTPKHKQVFPLEPVSPGVCTTTLRDVYSQYQQETAVMLTSTHDIARRHSKRFPTLLGGLEPHSPPSPSAIGPDPHSNQRSLHFPNKPHMSEHASSPQSHSSGAGHSKSKGRLKKPKPRPDYQALLQFSLPKSPAVTSSPGFQPCGRTCKTGFAMNPLHRVEVRRAEGRLTRMVEWENVARVTQLAEEKCACPICLERDAALTVAGECGHTYCLPCALALISSHKDPKCAVCSHPLPLASLRPFDYLPISRIAPHSPATFQLIRKEKTGVGALFPVGEPWVRGLPDSRYRLFNRITADCSRAREYYEAVETLWEGTAEGGTKAMLRAILDGREAENCRTEEETDEQIANTDSHYYFYQAKDGQPYFLGDLTHQCLLATYKRRCDFPPQLTAPVLSVSSVLLDSESLREYRFLRHFVPGETVFFAELDLSNLIPQEVLERFSEEIALQAAQRRMKERKEETVAKVAKLLREPMAAPVAVFAELREEQA